MSEKLDQFRRFMVDVELNISMHPSWRYGQAVFNTLYEINPSLADSIRGSDVDPFYADINFNWVNFWDWFERQTIYIGVSK